MVVLIAMITIMIMYVYIYIYVRLLSTSSRQNMECLVVKNQCVLEYIRASMGFHFVLVGFISYPIILR